MCGAILNKTSRNFLQTDAEGRIGSNAITGAIDFRFELKLGLGERQYALV